MEEKTRTLFSRASARDWTLNTWSADLFDCTGALYDMMFWLWIWLCHVLLGIKSLDFGRKTHTLFLRACARDWTLNAWSAELFDCTGVLNDLVFWFWIWSCHDLQGIKSSKKHKYTNGERHGLLCFLWSIDINMNKDSRMAEHTQVLIHDRIFFRNYLVGQKVQTKVKL